MTQKILAGLFLVAFFTGFIWLVGSQYRRHFDVMRTSLEPATSPVTLRVHHSTCRTLLPHAFERPFQWLFCASCMRDAERVRAQWQVTNLDGKCGRNGMNTLRFSPRALPVTDAP